MKAALLIIAGVLLVAFVLWFWACVGKTLRGPDKRG